MLPGDRLSWYLLAQYSDGGREWPELDCWGLVREFYARERGIVLDAHRDLNGRTMDKGREAETAAGRFREVPVPETGDLAGWFAGGRMIHAGIVLGDKVLHISRERGARLERIPAFGVKFYRWEGGKS